MNFFDKYKHAHLVGIGGISISAIAKLLLRAGLKVTGSDAAISNITEELEGLGVRVASGQTAANLPPTADLLVYSEAVPADSPERRAAKKRGLKEFSGAEFWGEFAKAKKVVAISGTNGKSTTTAMLGAILVEAGFDPTVVVGTRVLAWNSNIRIGKSDWLVIEADEYKAKLLQYQPDVAVITNIAPDHLDFYKNLAEIIATFEKWTKQIKPGGTLVLNANDKNSARLAVSKTLQVKRFNTSGAYGDSTLRAAGIIYRRETMPWGGQISFNIVDDERELGTVLLRLPGEHNAANALAAAAAADALGVKSKHIIKGLSKFKGAWRRFEFVGEYKNSPKDALGAAVFSDYAHHPAGIQATIKAARQWFPLERLVVLFQPHQHNRTKNLFNEFADSFAGADEVILAEVYDVAGREAALDQTVSSKDLAKAITSSPSFLLRPRPKACAARLAGRRGPGSPEATKGGMPSVQYASDLPVAQELVRATLKPGDVLIVMGAGDIDKVARALVNAR